MGRMKRVVLPEYPHHVVQRGVRSMNVFFAREDYIAYLQILKEQSERFGLEILSYTLMSNHVHLIVIPKEEISLARAIGETHRLYTRRVNFMQKTKGYLFQGRFFSTPLDEKHFIASLRYVEQNPLRAKMVKNAWDYPYSSARYRVGLVKEDNVLSTNDMIESIKDYRDFLKIEPEEIEVIKEKIRTGRQCGDDLFYEHIKLKFGKDLKPKKVGIVSPE